MYAIYKIHNWNGQQAVRWGQPYATREHAQEIANDLNNYDGTFIYRVKRI